MIHLAVLLFLSPAGLSGPVALFPANMADNANPKLANSMFLNYVAATEDHACIIAYADLLQLLDRYQCGQPSDAIAKLAACLQREGITTRQIQTKTGPQQGEQQSYQYSLDGKQWASSWPKLDGQLQQLCGEDSSHLGYQAGIPAKLLSFYAQDSKNAEAIELHFDEEQLILRYRESREEIQRLPRQATSLYTDGPYYKLVTETHIYRLQTKHANDIRKGLRK